MKSHSYFIKHKGSEEDAAKNQEGTLVETAYGLEGETSKQWEHKGGSENVGEGLEGDFP